MPLGALWGSAAEDLRERLMEARSPAVLLDILEADLTARLPRARGIHPAVAHALERFRAGAPGGRVGGETGYSHRHFIDLVPGLGGSVPPEWDASAWACAPDVLSGTLNRSH